MNYASCQRSYNKKHIHNEVYWHWYYVYIDKQKPVLYTFEPYSSVSFMNLTILSNLQKEQKEISDKWFINLYLYLMSFSGANSCTKSEKFA